MSFDKFDNKIKEVAEHHHPAYDEQAWKKMEKLLDKHLPVEDNRKRRIIFFILFLILLGSGGLFLSGAFNQKKKTNRTTIVKTQKPNDRKEKGSKIQKAQTKKNDIAIAGEQTGVGTDINAVDFKVKKGKAAFSIANKINDKKFFKQPGKKQESGNRKNSTNNSESSELKNKIAGKHNLTDSSFERNNERREEKEKPTTTIIGSTVTVVSNDTEKNDTTLHTNKPGTSLTKEPQSQDSVEGSIVKPASSSIKEKSKKKSLLFFTFSAGPDISFARTEKAGELKPVFGIGAGLNLGSKFTLRTGFYTGRKVYSSSPGSYNPPPSFYIYYPYLEKVDADCKVYEIPLSLSYNFKQSAKGYWFTSAGLSSYLMKKETYNYTYKYTPYGQSLNKEWSIENENNHFFSVLTLAGGYRRQLGKAAFIMVEPYLKLPLTGVGYGKVKLNSAGILFSIGIAPFNNTRNKELIF